MDYQILDLDHNLDHPSAGPRDYQRGNIAASVCATCGCDLAIPEIVFVDGEHVTLCTCRVCGTVSV